jgi:hypothetical protein
MISEGDRDSIAIVRALLQHEQRALDSDERNSRIVSRTWREVDAMVEEQLGPLTAELVAA